MIKIRDSEIANILPHTVKTPAKLSLSHALSGAFKTVYDSLLKVRIWQDLDDVDASLLDLIAAELSCPFYQIAETDDEKRRLIKAAYEYNRKIGTVEAVQKLVEAAFGTGSVQEWYEYGGKEFYFNIEIGENHILSPQMYKLFDIYINKIKAAKAKLETLHSSVSIENNIFHAIPILQYSEYSIGADEKIPEELPEKPYNKLGTTMFENFILG